MSCGWEQTPPETKERQTKNLAKKFLAVRINAALKSSGWVGLSDLKLTTKELAEAGGPEKAAEFDAEMYELWTKIAK